MSVIELVRDIWMNNACVKFEERSLFVKFFSFSFIFTPDIFPVDNLRMT